MSVLLIFLSLASGPALACSCAEIPFEEKFRETDLVFDGVVTAVRTDPDDKRVDIATFKVERAIKGRAAETREIAYIARAGTSCDMPRFGIGLRLRMFARNSYQADGFHTSYCTLTPDARPPRTDEEVKRLAKEWAEHQARWEQKEDIGEIEKWLKKRQSQQRKRWREAEKFIQSYLTEVEKAPKAAAEGRAGELLSMTPFFDDGVYQRDGASKRGWRDFERLQDLYADYERLKPDDPRGPEGIGRALYLQYRYGEAIAPLKRALALDPSLEVTHARLVRSRLIANGEPTPGVLDYTSMKAARLDLDELTFTGLDISQSKLAHVSAKNAVLKGAKLVGINSSDGYPTNVEFQNTDFEGADLSNANLTGVFDRAALRGMTANAGRFIGSFKGTDFSGAVFHEATLFGTFKDARFADASFKHSVIRGDASGVNFERTDLTSANMEQMVLLGTDLRSANLTDAVLVGSHIDCATQLPEGMDVRRAGLIPVKPDCAGRLQNRDFSDHEWHDADFSGLDLEKAVFTGTKIDQSTFHGANLRHARFTNATVSATHFHGADLTGADFSGAALDGQYRTTNGAGAQFHGAQKGHYMRTGIRTGRHHIALEKSALERRYPAATLKNVDFENAELRSDSFLHELDETLDADITGANLEGAKLYCTESYWAEVLFDPARREELPEGGMVQREMRLVRWIAENWPSVQLKHDFQDCSVYLGDTHGSRPGAHQ